MRKYAYDQCVEIMRVFIGTIEERLSFDAAERKILDISEGFPIHNLKQYLKRTEKYMEGTGEFGFGFPSNWAQAFLEVTNNDPLVVKALKEQQRLYENKGKGKNRKLDKMLGSIE